MEDYWACKKYGHNYIKLYYRPWHTWFKKVIYLQCIDCPHNTKRF